MQQSIEQHNTSTLEATKWQEDREKARKAFKVNPELERLIADFKESKIDSRIGKLKHKIAVINKQVSISPDRIESAKLHITLSTKLCKVWGELETIHKQCKEYPYKIKELGLDKARKECSARLEKLKIEIETINKQFKTLEALTLVKDYVLYSKRLKALQKERRDKVAAIRQLKKPIKKKTSKQ